MINLPALNAGTITFSRCNDLAAKNKSNSAISGISSLSGFNNTGDFSVLIGYGAGFNNVADNKLIIGNSSASELITGDFAAETIGLNGETTIGIVDNSSTTVHKIYGAKIVGDYDPVYTERLEIEVNGATRYIPLFS